MPQLSPIEILVIIMVALVVFGPEKLPQIARQIGRAASELRRMASEVKVELQDGLDLDLDDEPEPHPKHPNLINRNEGTDQRLAAAADKDEPDKDEPDKDEPDKDEPDKDEPDKDEPDKDEPDKDEPDKDEIS